MCNCSELKDLLDEKDEEIRQLKDLLGWKYDDEVPQHGMTKTQWRIFRTLQEQPQFTASYDRLHSLLPRAEGVTGIGCNSLKAHVSKMRLVLKPLGYEIQPVYGEAYILVDRNKEAA